MATLHWYVRFDRDRAAGKMKLNPQRAWSLTALRDQSAADIDLKTQLCIAPSQDGDWSIEPGKPYVSRYRLVTVDGPADAALFEMLWNDYATPATAVVK